MTKGKSSFWIFLTSGLYAVMCAPVILYAERRGWPEWPLHSTQLIATLICFISSFIYTMSHRNTPPGWRRRLAVVSLLLSGVWLAIICVLLLLWTVVPSKLDLP